MGLKVVVVENPDKGRDILGEAGSAIARPCMEELGADTLIKAHSLGDILYVSPCLLAQGRNLIYKRNLGGQEGVAGILDQLGSLQIGNDHRSLKQIKGTVQLLQHSLCLFALHSYHHPVWPHEVAYGRTFPQELRVGSYIKIGIRIGLAYNLGHFPGCPHRHSTFINNHSISFKMGCNLLCRGIDIGKVSMTVPPPGRGSHCNEYSIGLLHCRSIVQRKGKAAGPDIPQHQVIKPRLVDRNLPGKQRINPLRTLIYTGDIPAELCKAGAGNKSHISCSYDRYLHLFSYFEPKPVRIVLSVLTAIRASSQKLIYLI